MQVCKPLPSLSYFLTAPPPTSFITELHGTTDLLLTMTKTAQSVRLQCWYCKAGESLLFKMTFGFMRCCCPVIDRYAVWSLYKKTQQCNQFTIYNFYNIYLCCPEAEPFQMLQQIWFCCNIYIDIALFFSHCYCHCRLWSERYFGGFSTLTGRTPGGLERPQNINSMFVACSFNWDGEKSSVPLS